MYYRQGDERRAKRFTDLGFEIPKDRKDLNHKRDKTTGIIRKHLFSSRNFTTFKDKDIDRIQLLDTFHDTLQGVLIYLIDHFLEKFKIPGNPNKPIYYNELLNKLYFRQGRPRFKPKNEKPYFVISGSGYQKLEFYQVIS